MTDYFNTPKEIWQDLLMIGNEDIPSKLIIDGKIDYPKWTKIVLDRMENGRVAWMPNLVIGEYQGKLTGYGVCFGGPIASQFTHIYCKMGTKRIVQIGCGGGLQENIELGDIIISEGVLCLDGSSRHYDQQSDHVEFDGELLSEVISEVEDRGIKYHVGRTMCMYDILLWNANSIDECRKDGYIGADMESGAVASVARYFDTPAISFYVCSDNSVSGKDLFYEKTKKENRKIINGLDTLLDIALNL